MALRTGVLSDGEGRGSGSGGQVRLACPVGSPRADRKRHVPEQTLSPKSSWTWRVRIPTRAVDTAARVRGLFWLSHGVACLELVKVSAEGTGGAVNVDDMLRLRLLRSCAGKHAVCIPAAASGRRAVHKSQCSHGRPTQIHVVGGCQHLAHDFHTLQKDTSSHWRVEGGWTELRTQ